MCFQLAGLYNRDIAHVARDASHSGITPGNVPSPPSCEDENADVVNGNVDVYTTSNSDPDTNNLAMLTLARLQCADSTHADPRLTHSAVTRRGIVTLQTLLLETQSCVLVERFRDPILASRVMIGRRTMFVSCSDCRCVSC